METKITEIVIECSKLVNENAKLIDENIKLKDASMKLRKLIFNKLISDEYDKLDFYGDKGYKTEDSMDDIFLRSDFAKRLWKNGTFQKWGIKKNVYLTLLKDTIDKEDKYEYEYRKKIDDEYEARKPQEYRTKFTH